MRKHKESKKFAKMFLGAVGEERQEKALEELSILTALYEQSMEFRTMLTSPVFGSDEKATALASVCTQVGSSEETVKFMVFLIAKNAAWAMGEVLKKAIALYAERISRVTATVITAAEVGAEYEVRLKAALKKITKKDVEIEYAVDESLLGGMLVKVGSTMFDSSLRGQLRLLEEELIKG